MPRRRANPRPPTTFRGTRTRAPGGASVRPAPRRGVDWGAPRSSPPPAGRPAPEGVPGAAGGGARRRPRSRRGRVGVLLPVGRPEPGTAEGGRAHLVEVRVPGDGVAALGGVAAVRGPGLHGGGRACAAGGSRPGGGCCRDAGAECGGGGGGAEKGPGGGRGWREGVDAAGGAGEEPVSPAGPPARSAESWQAGGERGGGGKRGPGGAFPFHTPRVPPLAIGLRSQPSRPTPACGTCFPRST